MLWAVLFYFTYVISIIFITIQHVDRPIRALSWLSICLVLPVLGPILYIMVSRPLRRQRSRSTPQLTGRASIEAYGTSAQSIAAALERNAHSIPLQGRAQPLTNGPETFAKLMRSLQGAARTIDIEFYIFRDDQVGQKVVDVLLERASAGVHVRFLRDGWGSRKLSRKVLHRMHQHGIECRTFFPVRFPWIRPSLNHRDHCKIVVVDDQEAFVGGINVGEEYTGHKPGVGPWRDSHLYLKGDCVRQIHDVFRLNWSVSSPDLAVAHIRTDTQSETLRRPVKPTAQFAVELGTEFGHQEDSVERDDDGFTDIVCQTVEGGPDRPVESIRQLFFFALTQARHTIDLTTPYFAPDTDLVMALKSAVARGVRVRLLLPYRSDDPLIDLAVRTYFQELIEAGVDIYLYQHGTLHAKVMTVDDDVSVLGAANFDYRSFRLNYEVSEVLYGKSLRRQLTEQFERDLEHTTQQTLAALKERSFWERSAQKSARLLAPLL